MRLTKASARNSFRLSAPRACGEGGGGPTQHCVFSQQAWGPFVVDTPNLAGEGIRSALKNFGFWPASGSLPPLLPPHAERRARLMDCNNYRPHKNPEQMSGLSQVSRNWSMGNVFA